MVKEVLEVLRGLADSGMTMLIVTHEMKFAREAADTIYFLDDGKLVEKAEPEHFSPARRATGAAVPRARLVARGACRRQKRRQHDLMLRPLLA